MSNLYVFTAGNRSARDHLKTSITNPIDGAKLERCAPQNKAVVDRLRSKHGLLHAWGATPGPVNEKNWREMKPFDDVLTVFRGAYRFRSRVIETLQDKEIARAIWGTEKDSGQTWEFMYFLSKPHSIDVRLSALVPYLWRGYQGFTRISDVRSGRIREEYGSLDAFLDKYLGVDPSRVAPLEGDSALGLIADELEVHGEFDPHNHADARKKTLQAIVRRQGQPELRKRLLKAYGGRCAVTDCDVEATLEAAHITPYRGEHTNHASNGVLLRADIHTLFDCHLLSFEGNTPKVVLSPRIRAGAYARLAGRVLRPVVTNSAPPSSEALSQHRASCDW